jgi:hypothetical protein
MLVLHHDLGGKILWRSDQGRKHRLIVDHLRKTKVGNLNNAGLIFGFFGQENVLRLEITVRDTVLVLLSAMFETGTYTVRHCSTDLEGKLSYFRLGWKVVSIKISKEGSRMPCPGHFKIKSSMSPPSMYSRTRQMCCGSEYQSIKRQTFSWGIS